MNEIRIPRRNLRNTILFGILFVFAFLPDGIKNMFCLYKMTTSNLPLVYTYNYYFTFFDLVIIIVGLYCYPQCKIIKCLPIAWGIIIINCIRLVVGVSNVVAYKSYELILMFLEAICWSSILLFFFREETDIDFLLQLLVIFAFASQILQWVLGNTSLDGRVSVISLGPGVTAELYIKYELWFLLSCRMRKKSYTTFLMSAFGMMLTGSRSNMLTLGLIFTVFSFQIWREAKKSKTQNKLALLYALLAVAIVVLFSFNTSFEFINRFTRLFESKLSSSITSDSSYNGRIRSIIGGLRIWKENPMGIACSVYDIEYRSYMEFTMEYPHSSLLSYILLWSPLIAIPVFLYLVHMMVQLIRIRDRSWILMAFILVKYLINSAVVLYVSIYALDIILFTYFQMRIRAAEMKKVGITRKRKRIRFTILNRM